MKIVCIFWLFFLFGISAFAQNTKGDKPVSNQRQVRESKGKARAQRGNKKAKTKDVAGRRLRTKDKSSANRANVGLPQPNPYQGRKKTNGADRAAKPRGRIFSQPPREQRHQAWTGDIAGKPIRRIKPSKSGVARDNVYPQRGPYVNNNAKKPRKDKVKVYTRTASGEYPIRRTPQNTQRAWKGNIKGGSVGTPSRSGQIKNTYKQFGAFGNHPSRKPRTSDRIRLGGSPRSLPFSSSPWSSRKKKVVPNSASQSFLSRGKRNVYWGKFSKSGKAVTTDITGAPLRSKNFRSMPSGIVGRDTLRGFGRKPGGDRASKQTGGIFSTIKGQRAWTGDISGKAIRRTKPKTQEAAGKFFYPRKLSISTSGQVGQPVRGNGVFGRKSKRGKVETNSLPARTPGIGGSAVGKYLGKLKGRRGTSGGGSVSGKRWNNNGEPIDVNRAGSGTIRASRFQGNFRKGELTPGFSPQGADFSGNIKTRRPAKGGGSISGKRWNNNGEPIDVNRAGSGTIRASKFQGNFRKGELTPGFSAQGADFSGNIKARRPAKGGGSVSRKRWNNNGEPIDVNRAGSGTIRASKFQGNIKGARPAKGGGSISGRLWNNNGQAIDVNRAGSGTIRASKFQGNIKGDRPKKGGGSISGKVWNNNGQAIDVNRAGSGTIRASKFQGNIKTGKPLKGGGSVSGRLWNNDEQPIDVNTAGSGTIKASKFQGNIKTGKPLKGGGSVSGKLWNNDEQPIDVNTAGSGTIKGSKFQGKKKEGSLFKRGYVQNPNASKESIKKLRPDETTYKVAGLQVKVKERAYKEKPNAHEDALPGIAPKKSSVKAAEYARGVKVYWNYKHNPNSSDLAIDGRAPSQGAKRAGEFSGRTKVIKEYRHNPNSADEALKVYYPGKAIARLGDYQGNIKMHKYNDKRLHPDAKFAHGFRDNVKEERTFLMNVKLIWSKLFKKNDTQPDNLKEKIRKPRYDKGEQGMWYN